MNSPFPKYVCSVVRSLSVTLANACKFRIFIFLFLPAGSVIIVFVSSVVKIARFFLEGLNGEGGGGVHLSVVG